MSVRIGGTPGLWVVRNALLASAAGGTTVAFEASGMLVCRTRNFKLARESPRLSTSWTKPMCVSALDNDKSGTSPISVR